MHYSGEGAICRELGVEVGLEEAQRAAQLSMAFNCASYRMSAEAKSRQPQTAEAAAAPPVEAASAPAPAAVPAVARAPVATRTPVIPADAEVITIIREPAPTRPERPIIIAHRGDSAVAPENTLSAFRSALSSGAQAVEFDIHISRDGEPVVIHDATVDRCSKGSGAVRDMTLARLKTIDVGSWFSPQFIGERIPTLDEAIETILRPALLIMHLRAHENETDRCEKAVATAITQHNVRIRTIVTHHTRHGLQRLRDMDAKLRLCWIAPGGEPGAEYIDDAFYMGYRFVQPMLQDIDEKLLTYAHERGMWVNAFWADEVEDMRRLIELGVDGIITNCPARLQQTLQETLGVS